MSPVQCTYAMYTGHVTCHTHMSPHVTYIYCSRVVWHVICTLDMSHPHTPCRVNPPCPLVLGVPHLLQEDVKEQLQVCRSGHVFRVKLHTAMTVTRQVNSHLKENYCRSAVQYYFCRHTAALNQAHGWRKTTVRSSCTHHSPTKDHYRNGVMPVAWISGRTCLVLSE